MNEIAKLFAAFVLALTGATVSHAADPIAVPISEPGICANVRVLDRVSDNFSYQLRHVPHLPNVDILGFYNMRETEYLPQRPDWPVDRRYCRATVTLSNGDSRDVWYLVERPLGFAGIGVNVESCIAGFDRWYVYGGRCRVLWGF